MGQKADRCLCICWWSEASDWCSQVSLEIALLRRKAIGSHSNAACIVSFPARSKTNLACHDADTAEVRICAIYPANPKAPAPNSLAAQAARRVIARHQAIVGFGEATWRPAAPSSGTVAMEFELPVTRLSRRPKQLNEELLALDQETMRLEELDGFIAALLD